MNFLKKNKVGVILAAVMCVILCAALFTGGNTDDGSVSKVDSTKQVTETEKNNIAEPDTTPEAQVSKKTPAPTKETKKEDVLTSETNPEKKEPKNTTKLDEKKEISDNKKETTAEKKENICEISVRCDTILRNSKYLSGKEHSAVPKNGTVLGKTDIEVADGETVFDVLKRVLKQNNIHFEFSKTPATGSVYVEGIANIYERDFGDLSGWMYMVNGEMAMKACSEYTVQPGDVIEWIYTCNMGEDIGE